MKVSTQKFLQSSGSRNLDLLSNIKLKSANLSQIKMKLMQKSKAISAQSIQLMSGTQEALNNARSFYQKGYIEGYQKAFMEGVTYASKEFQTQPNLLSSLISNIKKRGDGGTLNQGQISIVGEKGPELMMAKQDVNIVPNKDIKYVPPSTSAKPVQTVVRTIIQKQGTKIVNRTKIM
tara:strand:- start:864 stop:1394 length:531 start_codon:yes stop_codon:yes gene_type:complete